MTFLLVVFLVFSSLTMSSSEISYGKISTEPWGIVIVDFRPKDLPPYHRTIRVLKRLAQVSPTRPIELFVSQAMNDKYIPRLNLSSQVEVKLLDLPYDPACCNRAKYGYISKVYALQNTSFDTAFFFDTDVWFCDRWQETVDEVLANNTQSKVLWVTELDHARWGDYPGENNTLYDSDEIFYHKEEYFEYTERNSGTIFGIRKSKASRTFLQRAIDLWHSHHENQHKYFPEHNGPISHTDQGALREAAFLERHHLHEALLSHDLFCRASGDYDSETCECNHCVVFHYGSHFDHCSKPIPVEIGDSQYNA